MEYKETRKKELSAMLVLIYQQGFAYENPQLFDNEPLKKIKSKSAKESIRFYKLIKEEATKRNIEPRELIEYFADNRKEFLSLLRKKDYGLNRKVKEKIKESLIKVSIPSLEQKFAIAKMGQLSIFDEIKDRELVRRASDLNIKIIGWDLTRAEDQAIFAIQKIYSKYSYNGNYDNGTALVFTPSEFYENYGVKKYIFRNKEVFSSAEKKQAYESLINLSQTQCIMVYNIRDSKTKSFNRIETLSAIIPQIDFGYTGLDEKEPDDGEKKKEKLKYIKITPSRVLLDQIEKNYYALLPSNLYTEIRDKFPKVKNKHLPLFIQWLAKTVALKKRRKEPGITEISFEKLSYVLRMDAWIKANQKSKIERRIKDCLKQAKALGYLNWYRIGPGKTIDKKITLDINFNMFKSRGKTEEIVYGDFEEEEQQVKKVERPQDSELVKAQKEKIRAFLGISKRKPNNGS